MRALLVGAGGMGRGWAKNLASNPGTELAGWIDVREGAAEAAAAELGLGVGYTGTELEAALRSVQPDFVVDVTPPEVHRDVTVAALGHGYPVLGEKPMASTMTEAREMVRAAEAAGKLYMVSQSRRYNGNAQGYRALISQTLGRLGILNVDFYMGAHFGGFRDTMPSPLVLDMAIHTFDMARFLTGKDPVSVYAKEFNPHWSWYAGNACSQCLFEMEEGLQYNYRGSWCAEGCLTSWEGEWRAVGEKGTAKWDGFEAIHAEVVSKAGGFISECERVEGAPVEVRPGIEGSLDEFLGALRTGATPMGECHDNIKSFAMVMAAYESALRGETVTIAEMLG
ncbi:MAG: Gfo/Idh/MocA family protein [Fimbriimonas sp.]